MIVAARENKAAKAFRFRFDSPLPEILLGGTIELHGWLFETTGAPVHGLRAVLRRRLRKRVVQRARRKRQRPDVAAAFPDLPQAAESGFLFHLQLGFGRNELEFQVLDAARHWQTFARATVQSYPLSLVERLGLPHLRGFLVAYLERFVAGREARARPVVSLPAARDPAAPRTRRVEIFGTKKSNLFILEIGELVAAGFRELGCAARLRLDEFPEAEPPADTLQIVLTPHEFYNLFLREQLSRAEARRLTGGVYLLCTEQPETGWFHSNLQWAHYARGVADINPLGVAAYRQRQLPAEQLQLGYHPMLEGEGARAHSTRTFDLTFLGAMTARRDEFLARHADFFSRHRCHLRLVPLGFAKTKQTRSYLDAAARNQLLSDTRILLNVHYSEQKYFEWHRMLVGLANGCCIITETCQGHGALVPGRHFVMVDPEYLIPACEYYLAHPEECAAIARAGREFVERELRQGQTCRLFLQEIEAPDADDLEKAPRLTADAAPAALSPGLRKHLARHTRRLLGEALREDLFGFRSSPAPAPAESVTVDLQAEQSARAQVIARRQGYRDRLARQHALEEEGKPIAVVHDNAPHQTAPAPELAVIITLYNYAQHIDECVRSVTAALAHLPASAEIVIVDDGSTDHSLARALAILRGARRPVRVVEKKFNTGLADARNVGLRHARAPYVFMMDADNLVYPQAFRQLMETITAGPHAAAYSLLCRFRGSPQNRVGLLSYYDWDPQILVQHPYIDAMALFHRATLLEVGGYDSELSQIGWFGWEDYDMWLRLAQREESVGFVANTLCLYRHHETSMINTTNLFELDLVRHFLERYGALLERFEPRASVFGVERSKLAQFHLAEQGR